MRSAEKHAQRRQVEYEEADVAEKRLTLFRRHSAQYLSSTADFIRFDLSRDIVKRRYTKKPQEPYQPYLDQDRPDSADAREKRVKQQVTKTVSHLL